MKKLVFLLPLALVLFSSPAFSQQTTTRTGPNGNGMTTTREKKCTRKMETVRTGPDGKSVTTTREVPCDQNR